MESKDSSILCSVYWLSTDRRAKSLPKVSDIGVFLRGTDLSRNKAFYHKYDLYAQYPDISNDEIENIVAALKKKKLVVYEAGYRLTKAGKDYLMSIKPDAFNNLYVNAQTRGTVDHYIGRYLAYNRVGVFKKKSLNEWLDRMEGRYAQVSPYELDEEQTRAWTDCHKVLQATFEALPKIYEDLFVIFEYVLPNHKPGSKRSEEDDGVRADAILVSDKRAVVLEFKQRDVDFEGFVLQAGKYKTRLERYHQQSKDMDIDAVLVLTKKKQYLQKHDSVITCSKDMLPFTLQQIFNDEVGRHQDIKAWLNSEFTG